VNKDGIDYLPAENEGFERYMALYHTPQAAGGCKDCRFFLMCRGQCPGTAIAGDWRSRSEQCQTWFAVFAEIEAELVAKGITPLSLRPERIEVEKEMVRRWGAGQNTPVEFAIRDMRARSAPSTQQTQVVRT
jgi:uncharacterized protein